MILTFQCTYLTISLYFTQWNTEFHYQEIENFLYRFYFQIQKSVQKLVHVQIIPKNRGESLEINIFP